MNRLIYFQCKAQRKMSGATCSITSKLGLALFLAAAVVILQGVDAQAGSFTSDLTITGDLSYDTAFALSQNYYTDPIAQLPYGTFSKTVGGVSTSSTFQAETVTGANPLSGTLTDLGDGFGISASAGDSDLSFWGVRLDLQLDITNNSSTDPYLVTFDLDFSNFVRALPGDSYADTSFTLFDSANNEIFFTDLLSDMALGNMENRVVTGAFGGTLTDSGTFSFNTLLGPGDSSFFTGSLIMDVAAISTPSYAESIFSTDITVADVELVPIPGAVLLGSIGLGFASWKLRRRKEL